MIVGQFLRNKLFWVLDAVKGSKNRLHYNEIVMSMNKNYEIDKPKIENILAHAVSTTNYYSKFNKSSLNDFPIINKNIIRENKDGFLSNSFTDQQRVYLTTSGSTGTPFKVFYDANKRIRNYADTLYFAELSGYKLGIRLYYLKIWNVANMKNKIISFLQNIIPVDVLNIDKEGPEVRNQFSNNKNPIALLGYVSALETLSRQIYRENKKINYKVVSIITMSESLDSESKKNIEKAFLCEAHSRYSNIENGILAQQTSLCPNEFLINTASYHIEIFDTNEDKIVPHGELGRIVVTDFYNKAMPLIRYDTGDLGILNVRKINGIDRLVFSVVEGRKLDQIFNTKGELISSYIVYRNMWKYTEINQYQFIQKSKNQYVFKVSMLEQFTREEELINEFKEYLGFDADFKIEYVNEIPLLNSGKRKKVINEMNLVSK